MSKALATILTQPLIVAKVGLQSRPPAVRNGKPFKSFGEVMQFIIKNEGALSLFKGIGPQILKGLLVQGILMMTKERYDSSLIPSIVSRGCELTRTLSGLNCSSSYSFGISAPFVLVKSPSLPSWLRQLCRSRPRYP